MGTVGLHYRGRESVADELRRRAAILRAQAERLEAIAARLEAECESGKPVPSPPPERAGKEV